LPFDGESPEEIIKSITHLNYEIPNNIQVSDEFKDLLHSILNVDYLAR
jgi:hypothetical protein